MPHALLNALMISCPAAIREQPATLDFGQLVNVLHVGAGVEINFENIVAQGFASTYDPTAQRLPLQTVGGGSWPTFVSEPGACESCAQVCCCHCCNLLSFDMMVIACDPHRGCHQSEHAFAESQQSKALLYAGHIVSCLLMTALSFGLQRTGLSM